MPLVDLIMLIGAAIIFAAVFGRRGNKSSTEKTEENSVETTEHLTETQIRWRRMWEEQELLKSIGSQAQAETRFEELIRRQYDMKKYIEENQRPFSVMEWFFVPVHPNLLGDYIKRLITIFIIYAFCFTVVSSVTILAIMFLINVVTMDIMFYNKARLLEITDWNPEFVKKFGDLIDKIEDWNNTRM